MDCCICSSVHMFRPPRNTICATCYEGAKNLLNMLKESETTCTKGLGNEVKPNSSKTLMNVWRCASAIKDSTEDLNERIEFLAGFVAAFRDQIHIDIFLKPGNINEPPIPAHKALMATRSEVFKNMLDSDTCKAAAEEAVTLPELSHGELGALLEFLYSGGLPEEEMKRHVRSLSAAADKYDIPYLRKMCERHMASSLSASTALGVLEVADGCSYRGLKDMALKFIVNNMQEIVFSSEYDAFALKNPHLCVLITRASLKDCQINNHRSREEEFNEDFQ